MQIRGLHRSIYRGARLASRLATKERSDVVERRDAVARWQQARRDGLTTEQAAKAVGTPLSTLYRWAKDATLRSRRPNTTRKTTWTTELVQAVEEWRLEEPTWGKAKIVVKLREQGFTASEATVGRILAHLVKRGAIEPVPAMRKAAKTRKWTAKRRFAERLPKSAKATQARPDRAARHRLRDARPGPPRQALHRLRSGRQMDRRQGLPARHGSLGRNVPRQARERDALQGRRHPGRRRIGVHGRVRGRLPAARHPSSTSCRQGAPSSTARWSDATAHGATSSTPSTTCQPASTTSTHSSTPSSIATTPTDPTAPLAERHPHSTLQPAKPTRPPSLICPERGHGLATTERSR